MDACERLKHCDGRWLQILDRFCDRQKLIEAIEQLGPSNDPMEADLSFAFTLIMAVRGWSLPETIRQIEGYLVGEKHPEDSVSSITFKRKLTNLPVEVTRNTRPLRSRLRAMWNEAVAIDHAAAEPLRRYFIEGGLAGIEAHAPNVRCHPALEYYECNELDQLVQVGNFPNDASAVHRCRQRRRTGGLVWDLPDGHGPESTGA